MILLVDAMGGDNAPDAIVNGCIDAINETEGFEIGLIGDSEKINTILKNRGFSSSRIKVIHTTEVITNEDSPTKAIRNKKDSSMVVGFNLLKEKKGDAFISAGSSGALMTGALLLLGRIKGVDRPAFPAMLPSKKGNVLLIDAGLNSTCKPINYLQFGILGSIYMKYALNIDRPSVGLMNMGTEEKKGTDVVKQAFSMLSQSNLNFTGNIEGNDVMEGKVHVVVCDGFVGNVLLKSLEGAAHFFLSSLKKIYTTNILTKLSALIVKKHFKEFKKQLDPDENGGAPILGVNGIVVKSHGSSNTKTIKNVVIKTYSIAKTPMIKQINEEFKNMEVDEGNE